MKLKQRTGFVNSDYSMIVMLVCVCMCVIEDVKLIKDFLLLEDTKFPSKEKHTFNIKTFKVLGFYTEPLGQLNNL